MIHNEILSSIRKQIRDVSVLKNGDFYCYARDDSTLREIYAIIEQFDGNKQEFDVILEEYCAGLSESISFDDINKFIMEFKKIIYAMNRIDEIINNLMLY